MSAATKIGEFDRDLRAPRTFRMHVFEGKGNRFAFTGHYSYFLDEDPITPEYDCSFFAEVLLSGEITYTGEHVDVPCEGDEIIFEHVKGDIASPRFKHGRATVYYLSGPLFDDARLAQASAL